MAVEPDTPAIMAFTGFLASGLGALLWARLNRIEDKIRALAAQWIDEVTRPHSGGSG